MPIYEYTCSQCGSDFELLVREGTVIECPECGSKKAAKKMSAFSAQSGSSNDAPPPCFGGGCDLGKCGSGRCGLD